MRLLTYSTLYPNAAQPNHGVFVENRLRKLVETGQVETRVVAPVPWFPSRNKMFGTLARAPRVERRFDISILHPRYPVIPKVGMNWTPELMYRFTWPAVARLWEGGYRFDAIDAHYFYPDGIAAAAAAAAIARRLGVPVVITSRGTDINLIPAYDKPRRMILAAAEQAAAMITVCQALKDSLVELGIDGDKVTALRNGVDLETFRPLDRTAAREKLGLSGPTLLSVGG